MVALSVRIIDSAEHLRHIATLNSVSFLQTPAWAKVKAEWRGESIGWFDGDELVGSGLILYRQAPRIKRSFAYLPEGPAIDWHTADLASWLEPLAEHTRSRGAFALRIGPPVELRRWSAATLKSAIADESIATLNEVTPDIENTQVTHVPTALERAGWRRAASGGGFAPGQPAFNFHVPVAGLDDEALLAQMNQQWRRNIRKADKAGVEVTLGGRDDLEAFHTVYRETAERDGFTPRPLHYFGRMWDALREEDPERIELYLAHHEGDLVAATIVVRVGDHVWYSYGASTSLKREVQGSVAVQWRMVRDARDHGARVYDMRGITETVDAQDPHIGLIRFKTGTGGYAVEYAGEWDLPLNRLLYRAFLTYLKRR